MKLNPVKMKKRIRYRKTLKFLCIGNINLIFFFLFVKFNYEREFKKYKLPSCSIF